MNNFFYKKKYRNVYIQCTGINDFYLYAILYATYMLSYLRRCFFFLPRFNSLGEFDFMCCLGINLHTRTDNSKQLCGIYKSRDIDALGSNVFLLHVYRSTVQLNRKQ